MKLERVCLFLATQPRYNINGEETQIQCACWKCGEDTTKNKPGNMSVKIEVQPGESMAYHCFRAECQASGILTTEDLQEMGCMDIDTLTELATWNKEVNPRLEKKFYVREDEKYSLVNLSISDNDAKMKYINSRLGVNFSTQDLAQYKIQLGIYDFLYINYISRLAFKQEFCDLLDLYTISFMSIYGDYLICRDITKKLVTGNRYTMYRIRGKPREGDTKIYSIPREINLLDPNPVDLNVAEGPFSILGAYLHTNLGRDQKNNIWLANCGSGYKSTIEHITRQFGLLDVNLHIWSDSEIKVDKYEKLIRSLKYHMRLLSVTIYYNAIAEDFGQNKANIKVNKLELI